MRILIVEDDPLTRLDLENRLVELGHSVKSAAAPGEAIEIGSNYDPEVVISDWQLGTKADGLDVCNKLLVRNPHLYIIMLTGASRQDLLQKSDGVPLKNVLAKPLSQPDLESILNRAALKLQARELA